MSPKNQINSQCVYVVYNKRFDMTKVGITKNPARRIRDLENACGCKLEVLFKSPPLKSPSGAEGKILESFQKQRGEGEWINGFKEEVVAMAREVCKGEEVEDRVRLYLSGMSIAEIARKTGVSRAAIIRYLKDVGEYGKEGVIALREVTESKIEKVREETPLVTPVREAVLPVTTKIKEPCPIELDRVPEIAGKTLPAREVRVGKNLYVSGRGYTVRWYRDGELKEVMFRTKADLLRYWEK